MLRPCHLPPRFRCHVSSLAFSAALSAQSSPPTTLKRMSPAPQHPQPQRDVLFIPYNSIPFAILQTQ